ncbi:MAG: hypothetical protein P4M14_07665 [Gammaproteobacteria bacterium]|nr:hypothetical protein [Gammaproteobacteria bacterium]
MKSYSLADKHKLALAIDLALQEGEQVDDKLTDQLRAIDDFHEQLKAHPKKEFNKMVQAIRATIPLTSQDDLSAQSALLVGLDRRIKEIAEHTLKGLLPEGVENNSSTAWQYRYGLLVGYLKDWQAKQKENEVPAIQKYAVDIQKVLETHHEEDYALLIWDGNNEIQANRTYSDLYPTAIAEGILLNVDEHKIYEERKAALAAKLANAEASYRAGLLRFNNLLNTLEAAELREKKNAFFRDLIISGKALQKRFDGDVGASKMSFLTASEVLMLQNKMLENLICAVQPNVEPGERNGYIAESQIAAVKIAQLYDDKIKELDTGISSEEYWGAVLVVVAAVLLTLAIAAIIAFSSGSFLGVGFAATEMVMRSGAMVSIASGTAVGCLIGGIYGVFGGVASLIGAISAFAFAPSNRPQLAAESFKSSNTRFDGQLVWSIQNAKSYGRFFKLPEKQIEGVACIAEEKLENQQENHAGEGQALTDQAAVVVSRQEGEEPPVENQPGLVFQR